MIGKAPGHNAVPTMFDRKGTGEVYKKMDRKLANDLAKLVRHAIIAALATCILSAVFEKSSFAQETPSEEEGSKSRIITVEEIKKITSAGPIKPLSVISYPQRFIYSGMEKGLIAFEQHKIRERFRLFTEMLRSRGVEGKFGGSGEGSGFGGGIGLTFNLGKTQELRFLGLMTFKRYQEFGVQLSTELPASKFVIEGSHQWRPQENFYGLGHDSLKSQHTNFALRQSWAGLRLEVTPMKRMGLGAIYRLSRSKAQSGQNSLFPSPPQYFSDLPGYGTYTRLQSGGFYFNLDYLRDEYQFGGAGHWGVTYHESLDRSRIRYFAYEMQLEGRLPIFSKSSVLVGQADMEFNRPRGGSDPIPFYLLPHIGGSSTMRGFELDRFYGKNLILLSLEYRYRIHPNIQAVPFFDEGQIFDNTDELAWLNWHRTYGFGLRFRSVRGTILRIEYGRSKEGNAFHIVFGDRERPPIRAPIRYGAYKR